MEIKNKKALLISILAATFSIVFIYQAAFGFWQVQYTRGLYIWFALVLSFLINPNRKKEATLPVKIFDYVLILLSTATIAYFIINFDRFTSNAGIPLTSVELTMGILAVVLVLEASRRTVGNSLAIIAIIFLAYTYFGKYMPTVIYHRGYSISRIISVLYASTDGIFGSVVYVFSTFIFLFVIFGSFIKASGAGDFFVDLSKAAVGRYTGGAGQTAVVSSWLLGSVLGSSTANTAITGSVTIPMMLSRGYKPHVAAAIEAVVSIGGQFMPPVMGAAAFLMAAFVGVPYLTIAKAGLLPALLFFFSMVFMVYLEAKRSNLKGIPVDELPSFSKVLLRGWYFFVPIGVIVYFLSSGYSPSMAGFWAIVSCYLASLIRKDTRMSFKDLFNALADGGKSSLALATTAGAVGILVAAISLPGLGMKFSSIILELANGNLPIALVLVMAASFVLGMGMNVSSAYLVLVTLAAPALVQMGVPLLTAHFFVFWTSQLSVITPPVCLSAYVAAAIAGADTWKTGWYSLRMGLSIYYVPLMFVYIPYLMWVGEPGQILWAFVTSLIGVLAFSAVMQGYLLTNTNIIDRVLLAAASISLIISGLTTDTIGFGLIAIVIFYQLFRIKKKNTLATT
jgi:TRAP transporter 4TM/12TM fusion protein